MNVAFIDPNACDRMPGCPARGVCSAQAIIRSDASQPWSVDLDRCTGCGKCVRFCPRSAVTLVARRED